MPREVIGMLSIKRAIGIPSAWLNRRLISFAGVLSTTLNRDPLIVLIISPSLFRPNYRRSLRTLLRAMGSMVLHLALSLRHSPHTHDSQTS
jgi:hypothetical protein